MPASAAARGVLSLSSVEASFRSGMSASAVASVQAHEPRDQDCQVELAEHGLEDGERTRGGSRRCDVAVAERRERHEGEVDRVVEVDRPGAGQRAGPERLEGREDAACYECHRKIDPLGFALENFDPIGAWRTSYSKGIPVDTSGELPGGQRFPD